MATDTSPPPTSEAAILGRPDTPGRRRPEPGRGRGLFVIRFDHPDLDRMHELAVRNQQDKLTAQEKAEMENYRRVSFLLDLMHSKVPLVAEAPDGSLTP